MRSNEQILKDCQAFLTGHFLLSSGKHSNGYVQCARVLMHPKEAQAVLSSVAEQLKDKRIDAVVGPAMGGIIVAYELGRQLDVINMFTERENDKMTLRRGFHLEKGQRVVIAEDVVTTGKSSLETIKALEEYGVEVVGLACIANRSGKESLEGYPIFAACSLQIDSFDKDDCPLCKKGVEIVKPGSRKKMD